MKNKFSKLVFNTLLVAVLVSEAVVQFTGGSGSVHPF
ncbi:hypothetical protein PAV_141p00900 (plasmid) [Paenibacillus alvei DSM 29]|nr:hypothetical protein PAV_141p00900 [Paenibacillus alvei DSM 29]